MKLILILSFIIFSSCKNKNYAQKETVIKQEKTSNISTEILTDTLDFEKKLALDNIYRKINLDSLYNQANFENHQISLPFQYSIKVDLESSFSYLFGDLNIDPKSSNCNKYNLRNHIEYKGNNYSEGSLYFVKNNDSTALTIEKFKTLDKAAYKKIYYSDNESIIFKNSRNNISVLQYKYLKDKKTYVIYYKINENFFAKNSEKNILDLSITRLRMAKNLFRKNKENHSTNWVTYKQSLSNLELDTIKKSFNKLISSIDTLKVDSPIHITNKNRPTFFSAIKMAEESKKTWTQVNTLPNHKFIDFNTLDYLRINQFIYFLSSSSANNFIKVEFKNSSSVILKRKENSGFGNSNYAILKKEKIQKNDILMYSVCDIESKEMAYFYFNLINNYNDL